MTTTSAAGIGRRLRRVRRQQQLSLADVEERSQGTWKAVVVGAYERGDRAVSIARLAALARFYGVPLADLLPGAEVDDVPESTGGVVLDLTSLDNDDSEPISVVSRFAAQIRRARGDHNGRVLSLRATDVQMLALTAGTSPHQLLDQLRERGALVSASE